MIDARVDALVIARVHASKQPLRSREIVDALARYAPTTITETQWRDQIENAVTNLQTRGVLAAAGGGNLRLRLVDPGALAHAIGGDAPRRWQQLSTKVLPALGLGVAAGDGRTHGKLGDKTHPWSAAIMARALGLWTEGPPPTLSAACDAYAWRQIGLPGKPKRCPAELRAHFVRRELGSDPAPPERQVRWFAAKVIGAPRAEPRALVDALVRLWVAGNVVGGAATVEPEPSFVAIVRDVAGSARDGVFGDRKVFIAAVWNELRRAKWPTMSLADFKTRLVAAHRAGDLALARADLVAAMDPDLVAASETSTDGASFHFIVREASS